MALQITEECIDCDMCESECPNTAISYSAKGTIIDPELCTECVGFYDEPTCISVCAIDCIITDPEWIEDPDALFDKFKKLVQSNKI